RQPARDQPDHALAETKAMGTRLTGMLPALVIAAVLEIGGDAAIPNGLLRASWACVVPEAAAPPPDPLTATAPRPLAFGPLMGTYVAVFFVGSVARSMAVFGERPSRALLLGGALIVAGALVIQRSVR